jgi:hypothetical protein
MISRAMFVQPKYAKLLNTTAIRQAMGVPEPSQGAPLHLADGISSSAPVTAKERK